MTRQPWDFTQAPFALGSSNGASASAANGRSKSRLAVALDAVEHFPVLTESKDRVQAAGGDTVRTGEIISTVESDVGLMIASLRLANSARQGVGERVATVPDAIEVIGPSGAVAMACSAPTFELLGSEGESLRFEQLRLHALSVQRAADQIAKLTGAVDQAELAVASLLHDIGHLVIAQLRPERRSGGDVVTRTPEARLHDEREALRIDHALVGGVLAGRWRLPKRISVAIEQHHADDASGLAAHVSLADMVVHYGNGNAFSAHRVETARQACELSEADLDKLLREFPGSPRQPTPDACPLSRRELEVLRRLSEGKRYGEIAAELDLTDSTVRSHLHNIYGKMGVSNRAQAALDAWKLGWI